MEIDLREVVTNIENTPHPFSRAYQSDITFVSSKFNSVENLKYDFYSISQC